METKKRIDIMIRPSLLKTIDKRAKDNKESRSLTIEKILLDKIPEIQSRA